MGGEAVVHGILAADVPGTDLFFGFPILEAQEVDVLSDADGGRPGVCAGVSEPLQRVSASDGTPESAVCLYDWEYKLVLRVCGAGADGRSRAAVAAGRKRRWGKAEIRETAVCTLCRLRSGGLWHAGNTGERQWDCGIGCGAAGDVLPVCRRQPQDGCAGADFASALGSLHCNRSGLESGSEQYELPKRRNGYASVREGADSYDSCVVFVLSVGMRKAEKGNLQ